MADVYRPHACTEREALERLASEADLGPDRLSRVRIDFDASVHRRITLWVPDVVGQSKPPDSAVGLDEGLAHLLVNATPAAPATPATPGAADPPSPEATAGKPGRAATPSDERLFISSRVSADAVVATLRRLERFATPARVARLRSETDVPGNDVWLLHILVDRGRHSGFAGLQALGLFDSWQSLSAYESTGSRLFLTAGVALARDLLSPLWRLMSNDHAASLLRLTPQGPRDQRFYVLCRTDEAVVSGFSRTNAFERITLPPHAFVDSTEVGFAIDASVRVSTVFHAVEPTNLVQELREQAPSRGYRLALESTRAVEADGRDLDRLRSQQAYLAQRVAYAESLHRPRPRLLRFNPRQLAALAHSIYSFTPDSLFSARPHVRYAFRATSQEPAGRHYLWIDPQAVRRTPDPLPLYERSPPMRFWLEPTWGRHYYEDGSAASCVFVPEHTALAPPLHTWIADDMDEHLRRVFARPGAGAASTPPAGAGCVYVLDGEPGNTGTLELTVLESAAFQPIDTSVNWLNDHIIVADRLDVTQLLRDTAAAARADLVAADAVDAASAADRDFGRDAARTRARFMHDLDAVISSVNMCTFDVMQRAHLAMDGMKKLDSDMASLADIRKRSEGIASVNDLLNGIDGLTAALRDRVSVRERDVGEALRQAEAQAEDEQRRVEAFLESLEARRADLRERLHGGK